MLYEYKGKHYTIVCESKIKLNGEWVDVVVYRCAYENPDGMEWVRFKEEFYSLFTLIIPK